MKKFSMIGMSLLLMFALAGCGGSSKGDMAKVEMAAEGNNYNVTYDKVEEVSVMTAETNAKMSEDAAASQTGRKLIKEVDMNIETKQFDNFIANLEAEVEAFGGYMENSNIGGVSYNYSESSRSAWFTVRIPEEQMESFVTKVGENGNITNISRNVRDVTLEYVDVEGRIDTLEAELTRLNELLGKAASLEDILAIEARISDVRYELESYQSQMNTYNNLIDYSTVYVSVYEVTVLSANRNESVWEQIRSGFEDSLYGVVQMLREIFVGVITSIPYIVVFGVVLFVIIKLIGRHKKKKQVLRDLAMKCEPEEENIE